MLGWEQENNLKALLEIVQFCLFITNLDKFQVYITELGISNKDINYFTFGNIINYYSIGFPFRKTIYGIGL